MEASASGAGDDRISIARIVTRLNIGGPAKHVLILSRRLPGYNTTLMTGLSSEREGSLHGSDPDVKVMLIPALGRKVAPLKDIQALLALRRYMKQANPQIVHTHMAKAGTLGRIASRWARDPIVIHTYHGHVLEGYFGSFMNKVYRQIERWLAKRTDVLVAVSPQIRDELLELGIGVPDQWRVLSLGLELDSLLSSSLSPSDARRTLELPDKPTVGIIGRLVPIKNLGAFIECARILTKRQDLSFVIAGDGPSRGELERTARDLGDAVRFMGWVEDLESLYAALDVVVLTSKNEGTPVALIEAMASGRPVVATDVGGVADCVPPFAGILVDPIAGPESIAEAIEKQLASPTSGAAARQWAKDRYSAERLVSDVGILYSELLDRRHQDAERNLV